VFVDNDAMARTAIKPLVERGGDTKLKSTALLMVSPFAKGMRVKLGLRGLG